MAGRFLGALRFGCAFTLAACSGGQDTSVPRSSDADSLTTEAADRNDVIGAFRLESRRDPMSDEERSFIYAEALGTPARSLRPAAAIWRCQGADLEFVIGAADFLTTSDPVTVQWRLDDRPPEPPRAWPVSTEGTAVFASDADRIAITEQAAKSERLRVRLTDFRGTHHDYEFGLAGLETALASLECSLAPSRSRMEAAALENARATRARAAQAAAAKSRADSLRAAEESAAAFAALWPWVGATISMTYMPTKSSCWRIWADSASAPFFKSEEEAKAQGFTKAAFCK